MPARRGFTLLELVVVLVLLGLTAAVAAPALRGPPSAAAGLESLLPTAREAAVRRGETVYLRVAESGDWRLAGASSAADTAIASGRVAPFAGLPLVLAVSPLGSCALDAASAQRAGHPQLDPLTCTVGVPPSSAP